MKKIILFIFIGLITFSCQQQKTKDNAFDPKQYKDPLMRVNKKLVESEDNHINALVNRYGWKMEKTGTGLRYLIYHKGNGKKALAGKIAKINYEVKLIDGVLCYSSATSGPKEFLIGRGGVESGLEEGILLMKVGDKAKFILPSHLAFGLVGDGNKIPPKATLVYDIELLELKENQ